MKITGKRLTWAGVTFFGMLAFVLLLTIGLLQPPIGDLVALATFLSISGGLTLLISLVATRLKLPRFIRTLRSRLVLVSVLTAVLSLVNVGFTAVLMFVSPHDLALLAGLLGFSLGLAVFLAFAFSEPMGRSVRELSQAVKQLSAGRLDTRVPVQFSDEIGDLGELHRAIGGRLRRGEDRENRSY